MFDVQNHFKKSFLNLVGAIKTSGGTETLTPGQIGFASAKTWQLIAPGAADVATHPEVYLVQGSLYKEDQLGKHFKDRASHGGYKESVKSRKINGRFITWFAKHNPVDEKPHVVQIGYNGSVGCACPEFEKDKWYWIRVEVKGSTVLRTYTRNLYRTIGVYTGQVAGDCPDVSCAESADPKKVFEKFAEQIKLDPEVSQFLKEVKVVTEGTTSLSGTLFGKYQASRCDDGGIQSFAEVAAVYGNDIKLVSHVGSTSTYEIVKSGSAPSNSVPLDLTWTKVDEFYKVTKKICLTLPLKADGTSNLSDVQTFYDGILTNITLYDEGTTTTSTTTTTSSTTSTSTSTTTEAGQSYVGCTETLQADLLSDNTVDLVCEGVDAATFTLPQSYEGYSWEDCPCDTVADNLDQCVGLRLVAKKVTELTDTFSDASFSQFDHVEFEPVKIIVSFVDMDGSQDFKPMPVTEIQQPVIRQGIGETVVREMIQSAMYEQNFFFEDNRMREVTAYPYLQAVNRADKYVTYYLAHNVPTGIGPSGSIGQDRFLYRVFVKQGVDASTFETWMGNYLTSAGTGVSLQVL